MQPSIPPLEPDHYPRQKTAIETIFGGFARVPTLTDPHECACVYELLGAAYLELYMYGRSMEMFRKSLEEEDSCDVRETLARLHANLLGDGKAARELMGSHPPHDPTDYQAYLRRLLDCSSPLLGIEEQIYRKEHVINRHQRCDRQKERAVRDIGGYGHLLG